MSQEALKILLKLQELFPGNRNVAERLESLGEEAGISDTTGMPGTIEKHEMSLNFLKKNPLKHSPDWGDSLGEKRLRRKA